MSSGALGTGCKELRLVGDRLARESALPRRLRLARWLSSTAVLPKIPHSNCCKRVPNRPLRGR